MSCISKALELSAIERLRRSQSTKMQTNTLLGFMRCGDTKKNMEEHQPYSFKKTYSTMVYVAYIQTQLGGYIG